MKNLLQQLGQLLVGSLILVAALAITQAQDSNDWRYKVGASFSNSNFSNQNTQGFTGFGHLRVLKYGNARLEGVLEAGGNYDQGFYFHQLTAGPQVSADFGRFTPFARGLFGATRFTVPGLGGTTKFTSSVGGGLDVNLGKFFVRPAAVDFQWIDDTGGIRFTRYSAGLGVRF